MKFLTLSLCAVFCAVLIKDKHKTIAFALSVSGVCLILLSVATEISKMVIAVNNLTAVVPSTHEYVSLMLKVLAITLLTQLISDLCRDNGESALASTAETAAKITVIVLVFPLFETVIKIVIGMVK